MDRRDFIKNITAASVALAGAAALADEHKHGEKGEAKEESKAAAGASEKFALLIKSASACLTAGTLCLDHCLRLLADGDKSLGACAKAVRQMLPLCDALLQLASEQSAYGKDIAAICAKACKDCAEVCKEHADHHQECKDCLEACNDCAKSCEAFAA